MPTASSRGPGTGPLPCPLTATSGLRFAQVLPGTRATGRWADWTRGEGGGGGFGRGARSRWSTPPPRPSRGGGGECICHRRRSLSHQTSSAMVGEHVHLDARQAVPGVRAAWLRSPPRRRSDARFGSTPDPGVGPGGGRENGEGRGVEEGGWRRDRRPARAGRDQGRVDPLLGLTHVHGHLVSAPPRSRWPWHYVGTRCHPGSTGGTSLVRQRSRPGSRAGPKTGHLVAFLAVRDSRPGWPRWTRTTRSPRTSVGLCWVLRRSPCPRSPRPRQGPR